MNLVKSVHNISVPKGAGVEGFLKVLRRVLQVRGVQNISINKNGVVEFTHYSTDPENNPLEPKGEPMEFLTPYDFVRKFSNLIDVPYTFNTNAAEVICRLLDQGDKDNMLPFAFLTGTGTLLWDWHEKTSVKLHKSQHFYGLPLIEDQAVSSDTLILCTSYERTSSFYDILNSYKISLVM